MKKYDHFQKGSGVYTCLMCGKQTRETGNGESSCKLCSACYDRSGWENHHSDEGHTAENPGNNCPICKSLGWVKA